MLIGWVLREEDMESGAWANGKALCLTHCAYTLCIHNYLTDVKHQKTSITLTLSGLKY